MTTLQKYIETLQKFAKEHPEAASMQVVYAVDDEGNAYHPADEFEPAIGHFEDGDFCEWNNETKNAVCIN